MKILIAFALTVFHTLSVGDELLGKSDDELVDMIHSSHPDMGCLLWRYEARHFYSLFPEDSVVPEAVRNDLIRRAIGLDGKNREPVTSVNYILKKIMFDMGSAKSSPADTEMAVFSQCGNMRESLLTVWRQAGIIRTLSSALLVRSNELGMQPICESHRMKSIALLMLVFSGLAATTWLRHVVPVQYKGNFE